MFYFFYRSAIYANRFYLSLFWQRNQDRLASNSEGHATILGKQYHQLIQFYCIATIVFQGMPNLHHFIFRMSLPNSILCFFFAYYFKHFNFANPPLKNQSGIFMFIDCSIRNFVSPYEVPVSVDSGRNRGQKLVSHFLKIVRCRSLIATPLKMYSKFSQPKWILVGQMVKLVGKWPMASCYF